MKDRKDTYVVFGEQTRTELEIVIEVKRSPSLEALTESGDRRALRQLLHASHTTKRLVRIL
jgi:hypothetical protein